MARRARAVAARARDARVRARRASRSTSARRRRTCSCRSTASSPSRRSRSRGSFRRRATASRELGPLAWPLALFVAWEGLAFLWSKDVRQGAIELLFFVLPFGLLAVALARLPWSRAWVLDALRAARGDGARVRRDRDRPVRDAQHLLEPEGARRQRLRAERLVLPRQLGLLRPVDLRALPRRRDPREPGRRALRRGDPLWRIAAVLTIGITWAGLAAVVLAVELRRADRRDRASAASSSGGGARPAARRRAARGGARRRLAVSPAVRHRASLSHVTSGRSTLVTKGVKVAVHHPVDRASASAASAAPTADLAHLRGKEPKAAASHTTPVTVAAETGHPRPRCSSSGSSRPPSSRRSGGSCRRSTVPRGSRSV